MHIQARRKQVKSGEAISDSLVPRLSSLLIFSGRTFDLVSECNTFCACAVAVGAEPSPEWGARPVQVRMYWHSLASACREGLAREVTYHE